MIKRLRRKLIAACMLSLTIVLLVILGGVNLMSYQKVVADADTVLAVLEANDGVFPQNHMGQDGKKDSGLSPSAGLEPKRGLFDQRAISPETPYESRFFTVLLGEDGQVLETDTGQIAAVDGEDAAAYAQNVSGPGAAPAFGAITAISSVKMSRAAGSSFWTAAAACPPSARLCLPVCCWHCWGWWQCWYCCWSCPGALSGRWRRAMKSKSSSLPTPATS